MARLLVLDFHGVCTFSDAELIERNVDPGDVEACVRPDVAEIVDTAQTLGIEVVVLSNELDPGLVEVLSLLKQVDRIVLCADNGIYKPDRRAFQRCLLLTGAVVEQTLVVDDGADNIAVAASLGMETVHFDGDSSWGPVTDWIGER